MGERETWLALAERCEAATGPDREIDLAAAIACGKVPEATKPGGVTGHQYFSGGTSSCVLVSHYSASLDAAMSLVPEGWSFGAGRDDIVPGPEGWAWVSGDDDTKIVKAITPALALAASACRARAHLCEGDGER